MTDRFWSRVKCGGVEECWEWQGARLPKGYGRLRLSNQRRTAYAHRTAWELLRGPIPEGLHVLHKCDNPPCCNPSHLKLGTNTDNIADKVARGRTHRLRGELCGAAKLSARDVAAMRSAAPLMSRQELAVAFGVSRVHVGRILSGKQWVE